MTTELSPILLIIIIIRKEFDVILHTLFWTQLNKWSDMISMIYVSYLVSVFWAKGDAPLS